MSPEHIVEELRELARRDPAVLGFALTGSRARGLVNASSDYDCALFVQDGALERFEERYRVIASPVDLRVFTPATFREHAQWGSTSAWDRYNWADVEIDPDRSGGELQAIADEKGRVPPHEVAGFIAVSLDRYLNQVCRSLKCLRAGDATGALLEASESIRPLLDALFAAHEGRLVPYYKYLAWELERRPLTKLGLSAEALIADVMAVSASADAQAQARLLAAAERLFRAGGVAQPFDEWKTADWPLRYFAAM